MPHRTSLVPLRRPRALELGDRVAVVAPSGPVDAGLLEAGCAALRSWGLEVCVTPHARDTRGYLAGRDADRAADFVQAWCDPEVAGVLCARGGYGVQRVIDLLDWDALADATRDPDTVKAFAGASDVTALHEALAARLEVATFFGPMVATHCFASHEPSREALRRALHGERPTLRGRALVGGTATGVTVGGTASMLASSAGTWSSRPAGGGIAILEDVAEEPYRLDRILTQLLRSCYFEGVAGIALGSWVGCGSPENVQQVILDRLGGLGVPVLADLGFGHGSSQLTVPLGVAAHLDADAGALSVLGAWQTGHAGGPPEARSS
ncbi:MAG: S66 peptidase family protein [Carbonactinosporaceae bacterium]